MFSGIIETLGTVRADTPGRVDVVPQTPLASLEVGESIAVNGVCLTVSSVSGEGFTADVMPETLHRTTLGGLTDGAPVNLERALHFGDRVGGHMVSGHVDGTGIVTALREDANARWVTIATPEDVIDLIAEKGCIAVDGISLTVVDVFEAAFTVSLIPVTLAASVAGAWRVATPVNLEVDLIARYVARTLAARDRGGVVAALEREG
ncbi:MAG TPA: riboflavin synthase [Candidatus Saccharimonadales bacterium]|nr:riboflavin synthase [Candidatus Saccharimonadales bacterium]